MYSTLAQILLTTVTLTEQIETKQDQELAADMD
jgi:hypothetical protein